PPQIYTLSLHDALPISVYRIARVEIILLCIVSKVEIVRLCRVFGSKRIDLLNERNYSKAGSDHADFLFVDLLQRGNLHIEESKLDRKSTRLNSSHVSIS